MNRKKALVLGGTGAMGTHVVPELVSLGYKVDVVSLDQMQNNPENINYIKANAKNEDFLAELLKNNYDAIIDFMIYSTAEYSKRHKLLLDNTEHLIFLSSCRVCCTEPPTKEQDARHLDVSTDKEFLATAEHEYSLYKV